MALERQSLYFNTLYRSDVYTFTDNGGFNDVVQCNDVPTLSSGFGFSSPYVLKAGDFIIIKNIIGIVTSAGINTGDAKFDITYTKVQNALGFDYGIPEVGDEVIAIQYNDNLTDYDTLFTGSYYSVSDYTLVSQPNLDITCQRRLVTEHAYYGNSYISYNTETDEFVDVYTTNRFQYERLGFSNNGQYQFQRLLSQAPALIIADCADPSSFSEKVVFDSQANVSYSNGRLMPSYSLRVIN